MVVAAVGAASLLLGVGGPAPARCETGAGVVAAARPSRSLPGSPLKLRGERRVERVVHPEVAVEA